MREGKEDLGRGRHREIRHMNKLEGNMTDGNGTFVAVGNSFFAGTIIQSDPVK